MYIFDKIQYIDDFVQTASSRLALRLLLCSSLAVLTTVTVWYIYALLLLPPQFPLFYLYLM